MRGEGKVGSLSVCARADTRPFKLNKLFYLSSFSLLCVGSIRLYIHCLSKRGECIVKYKIISSI